MLEPIGLRDSGYNFSVASAAQRSVIDDVEEAQIDFEKNLQMKTDDELDDLHRLKMSALDDLQNSLKQSIANLPYYEQETQISPEVANRKVGMATMKTDQQKESLEDQLQRFREETKIQMNPFASKNFERINEESGDLDMRKSVEDPPSFQEDQPEIDLDQLEKYE